MLKRSVRDILKRSQMQILSLQSGVYTKIRVSNKLMMIKFPLLEKFSNDCRK